MPRADLERFPKLIIEIPESQFPDKIRIVMKGRKISFKNKTEQLAVEVLPGRFETLDQVTLWTEKNFRFKSADGSKKVVKVDMPYNEITSVSAWAQRDNFEDSTSINVNMYTTTAGGLPSASGTTRSLEGVWAFSFTLNKQELTVDYCTNFLINGPSGQLVQSVASFASEFATVVAQFMKPSLPTPKAIAAKLLGPAAPAVQSYIAIIGQQIAEFKPIIETVIGITRAITSIIRDPSSARQYLPTVFAFMFEFIPKEDLAKIIYDFQGGTV